MASLTLTAIATSAQDGPIVGSIGAGTLAKLATYYAFDYSRFLTLAQTLVNSKLIAIEAGIPEQSQVELVLPNLRGPLGGSIASQMAAAITKEWMAGKLVNVDGTMISPWPGQGAIAYPNDTTATLTLRWTKGQPWVWLVIAALLAISAIAVYLAVRASNYTMSTAQAGGTSLNPLPWLLRNWWTLPVGAGVLAAAPFVITHVKEIRQAEES